MGGIGSLSAMYYSKRRLIPAAGRGDLSTILRWDGARQILGIMCAVSSI
jgi:hypothetical protein